MRLAVNSRALDAPGSFPDADGALRPFLTPSPDGEFGEKKYVALHITDTFLCVLYAERFWDKACVLKYIHALQAIHYG